MRILIQRVLKASVEVDQKIVSSIDFGLVAFVGITHSDTELEARWLADKLVNLRIFSDEFGKINQSLKDKKGEALIVSQFTLYADCGSGRRPSFTRAASPQLAESLYELFIQEMRLKGIPCKIGVFGADMKVSLINDGPVTLMMER